MNERKIVAFFILLTFVLLIACIPVFNGTVDSGDSVMHYLFARFALNHPASFLDNWAKPVYVVLATPFAQMGFNGIKLFNCINTVVSMSAAYLIAKRFDIKYSWLVPVLLFLSPLNFALSYSGLTEPLFASVLAGGLCLLFYDKIIAGLIVLSFLPFIRSEGMFLLMPIIVYQLIQRKFISIPWLLTGNVVYAIIGYFHFKDFLWFYHANPYSVTSKYGGGFWNDYFDKMPLILGTATYNLAKLGFVLMPFVIFRKQKSTEKWQVVLVWVIASMYFFFHVISHRYGLFGSFGMARIIIGVCPLMVIMGVYGLSTGLDILSWLLSLIPLKKAGSET